MQLIHCVKAEAAQASRGDLLIKHVGLLSAGNVVLLHEQLLRLPAPLLKRHTLLFLLPVSNEGCVSIVAENSEDSGSRPSVCALIMPLVNWPAAACFKRNSEFKCVEIHFLFPHSGAAARRLQVSSGIVPHKPLFHFVFRHL